MEAIKREKKNRSPNSVVNQSWCMSNGKRKLFCIFFWSLMRVRVRATESVGHLLSRSAISCFHLDIALCSITTSLHSKKNKGGMEALWFMFCFIIHPQPLYSLILLIVNHSHNITSLFLLYFLSDMWQNIRGTRRRQAEMCLRWIFTWQTAH